MCVSVCVCVYGLCVSVCVCLYPYGGVECVCTGCQVLCVRVFVSLYRGVRFWVCACVRMGLSG